MPGAASIQMMASYGNGDVPLSLTQKGYGLSAFSSGVTLEYGNVISGSAPAAGDLVCWVVLGIQASPTIQTLTGWTQNSNTVGTTFAAGIFAKVLQAGDISSPPQALTGGFSGGGFWVAYSVSGSISSLAVSSVNAAYGGTSNVSPTSQTCNSSALVEPAIAITIGGGGGDDGSPSTTISGATAEIDYLAVNYSSTLDTRFFVNATAGGANITFSKPADDGTSNHLTSGYVTVS